MRVATVDAAGRALNEYPGEAPTDGAAPTVPYAVYLTDVGGRFRLLGFDLDATRGPVGEDLAELRSLLERAGLGRHVVCASGPGGGRHVWVALAQPVPPADVAAVADQLARRLPTLDKSPLTNPATGALRPPGAPHRCGGVSRVLEGDLAGLLAPTAGPGQVAALLALLGPPAQAAPRERVGRGVGSTPAATPTCSVTADRFRPGPAPSRAHR